MSTSSRANPNEMTKGEGMTRAIALEKVRCPRCNADNSAVLFENKDYRYGVAGTFYVSECQNCGLWFQNPCPIPEHLPKLYPENYSPHQPRESRMPIAARKTRYLKRNLGYTHLAEDDRNGHDWTSLLPGWFWRWYMGVKLVPHYRAEGKLLEIGCARGAKLLFFRHLGWKHLYGIELMPQPAEAARARGFLVECGPVETAMNQYPDEYFDVVFCTMVLEHLYNPFRVVQIVAQKLKPAGQFLFSTVVRDSLDVRMYGRFSRCFDLPRHLVYFQEKDIFKMLEKDFDQIECFHYGGAKDFVWPATWRREYGQPRLIDQVILTLGRSFPSRLVATLLAWLGLTLRVSFRCLRKA